MDLVDIDLERAAFEAWLRRRFPTLPSGYAINLMRDAWIERAKQNATDGVREVGKC